MAQQQREQGRPGQERAPGRSYVQSPTPGRSGLVTLGVPKRGRGPGAPQASTPAAKLAIPKPVNLPSLKKENAGLDPNTQLVPVAGGGWNKPEEPPPPPQPEAPADEASPLTAGSTWGSAQSRSAAAPWQPPDPSAPAPAVVPFKVRSGLDRRRLNPSEYPSLEAAGQKSALVTQLALNRPPTSALLGPPSGLDISSRNWDDEDRVAPAPPPRPQSADWHRRNEQFEDERRPFSRPADEPPQPAQPPPVRRPADEEPHRPPAVEPPSLLPQSEVTAAADPSLRSEREPSWAREQEQEQPHPRDREPPPLRERERSFPPPLRDEQPDASRWRGPPPPANGRGPRSALTDEPPLSAYGGPRGGYDDRGPLGRRGSWDDEPRRRFDDRGSGYGGRRGYGDGPPGSRGGPHGRYDGGALPLRSALTSGPPYGGSRPDDRRPLHSALAGPPPPADRYAERRPTPPVGAEAAAQPPREAPPPPLPAEEEVDDSEAFNAELDRIAAEKEERKRAKEQEAAAAVAAAIEAEEAEAAAAAAAEKAEEARRLQEAEGKNLPKARAEALAAEAEVEERRKAAAQAKLQEINARIAAREAEAAAAAEAERLAAEARAAEELEAAEEAAAAEAAAMQAEEAAAAAAKAATPAASEAETVPLLSSSASVDPAPATPSPPPASVPIVNAWSKPLSLGPPSPVPAAKPAPELQVSPPQQPQHPAAPPAQPAVGEAASPTDGPGSGRLRSENAWDRPEPAGEEPGAAETQTGQRGARAGRSRSRVERAAPRDIATAPNNRQGQQQQLLQQPQRTSPKEAAGRKRNRDRNKPAGRTLPLPISPKAGQTSQGATFAAAAPPPGIPPSEPFQASATSAPQQEPQPMQGTAAAALGNGPASAGNIPEVGKAIADLVLAESPAKPDAQLAPPQQSSIVLDPVVPSAGGAAPIARPRSTPALDDTLASGVLANGIPALPADLSLDASAGSLPPSSGHSLVPQPSGFGGFQAPQQQQQPLQQQHGMPAPHAQGISSNAFSSGGGFGFGGFGFGGPVPASAAGLWQQPAPQQQPQQSPPQQQLPPQSLQQPFLQQQQQQQHHHQQTPPPPGLLGSQPPASSHLDAFYGGGQRGSFGSSAFSAPLHHHQPPQQQHSAGSGLQAPQFGNFGRPGGGGAAAFGGFGQTAFVPTGKQPDWSVPSTGGGLQPGLSSSASQDFATGHAGSGSLGSGAPLQPPLPDQQQDRFGPQPLAGQQHSAFGAPGLPMPGQPHSHHAFFNQVPHNALGLGVMGGGGAGSSGGLQPHDLQLPEDLVGAGGGEDFGLRQRPGSTGGHQRRDSGPKGMRGGRAGPSGQFGGPPMRGGRGRGPQQGPPLGRTGGRAPAGGRGAEGRGDASSRGRVAGRGRAGGRSPGVMKPAYADSKQQTGQQANGPGDS